MSRSAYSVECPSGERRSAMHCTLAPHEAPRVCRTPHNREASDTPSMPSRAKYESDFLASLTSEAPAAAQASA